MQDTNHEPLTELEFVTGLLADPTQFSLVEDITPTMLQDHNLRVLYSLYYDKKGRITQGTLFDDLMKTVEGRAALNAFAQDMGCPDNPRAAIDQLFRQGVMTGDTEILANRIRNEAQVRWVYRAVQDIKPDKFRDAGEFAITLASQITDIASRAAPNSNPNALSDGADEEIANWKYSQDNPHKIQGLRVNLGEYDEMMGGLMPGELVLIGGHSGEGKTQLMCHMALEAATTPRDDTGICPKVAFFSLEMGRREIASRWLSKIAGVSLKETFITGEQKKRIDAAHVTLKELARQRNLVLIEPHVAHTVEQITRMMIQLKQQNSLDMAFIDYAQLIRSSKGESRYEALADISQRIKQLSHQLQVPVIMGVQLNREALTSNAAGRPSLHNVADSMDLVRSADIVHFMWTPARHLSGGNVGPWAGIAVLMTPKRRNGIALPDLYYGYYPDRATFTQVSPATRNELLSPEAQELISPKKTKFGASKAA